MRDLSGRRAGVVGQGLGDMLDLDDRPGRAVAGGVPVQVGVAGRVEAVGRLLDAARPLPGPGVELDLVVPDGEPAGFPGTP